MWTPELPMQPLTGLHVTNMSKYGSIMHSVAATEMYCLFSYNTHQALIDVSSLEFIHRCTIDMDRESTCNSLQTLM